MSDSRVASRLARVERIAAFMDDGMRVPGTNIRFGWDSVIGLIPGVGDLVGLGASAYLLWEVRKLGIRKRTYVKMLANAGIDFCFGALPVAGDLFDFYWKSHRRNVRVLRAELTRLRPSS